MRTRSRHAERDRLVELPSSGLDGHYRRDGNTVTEEFRDQFRFDRLGLPINRTDQTDTFRQKKSGSIKDQ